MPILEVNLRAVEQNIAYLRKRLVGNVRLMPVIKADAYGLGASKLAQQFVILGVNHLVVFSAEEASDILKSGFSSTLIVLQPIRELSHGDALRRGLSMGRVELVVHDMAHLSQLASLSERYVLNIGLQLKIDTGLSRGGCSPEEAGDVLESINKHPLLNICGVMTHFSDAASNEQSTRNQAKKLLEWLRANRTNLPNNIIVHAANTAGTHRSSDYHFDAVRVGLAWTGSSGIEGYCPVARVLARIIQVKKIKSGQPVGYGGRWVPSSSTKIGLVDIGYANGLPSDFSSLKVPLRIWTGTFWQEVPVVGAVSMDQLAIDLGSLKKDILDPRPGTMIEVISQDVGAPNALHKIAKKANKPPHEFLCAIGATSPRRYVRDHSTEVFEENNVLYTR